MHVAKFALTGLAYYSACARFYCDVASLLLSVELSTAAASYCTWGEGRDNIDGVDYFTIRIHPANA
jgi:hypothetical protein